MTLTFHQGNTLAHEFNMSYADPYWPEDIYHTFSERKMIRSHWVNHTFSFATSVQDLLEQKLRAIALRDTNYSEDTYNDEEQEEEEGLSL